ncbi:MAG: type II CRISPR-associated endonuclease Cas1 [Clostridia bacterium]|nr:type II CRISPR-associated endonuclease Cas1 [Clostridia bacterium]
MGFRTVVIKNRAKLEFRLNSLIVRGETEKKIYIAEINTLIVQSTAVSFTASLLNELTKRNIKVIFCDEKCNPSSEVLPYYGAHNTAKKYKEQFSWEAERKARVWRIIVRQKILEQAKHLRENGFIEACEMLFGYADEVEINDRTNREGHAAKVYFNCLLGLGNSRQGGGFFNGCLNYGYAILLSAFNREIVASGYLTQLGIWHDNEFNPFNLACDLMEPFRVVVDRLAFRLEEGDKEFKKKIVNILNFQTVIGEKRTTLDLAIRQYTKSVFHALDVGDESAIMFPEEIIIENEL